MAKLKEKKKYIKIRSRFRVFGCHQDWKRSARAGGAVGEDVSALPGQMIASSSVTLRARSSRSACKSWNICKLMSYQRAVTVGGDEGGGHWVRGGLPNTGSWVLGAARDCSCTRPKPLLSPLTGRYGGSAKPLSPAPPPPHHPPNPTSDPCLKLTLPQASYSPWIPIIVSRIKTLSAKIFSASLIWCIPSPCEDRYSCQGKENKPEECSPQCKTWFCLVVFFCFFLKNIRFQNSTHISS